MHLGNCLVANVAVLQPLCAWVDAHHCTCSGNALLCGGGEFGMNNIDSAIKLCGFAKDNILLANLYFGFYPLYSLKIDKLHLSCAVLYNDGEAVVVRVGSNLVYTPYKGPYLYVGHCGLYLPYGVDAALVYIAIGQKVEEVSKGLYIKLFGEQFRSLRTNAGEKLYLCLKYIRHKPQIYEIKC